MAPPGRRGPGPARRARRRRRARRHLRAGHERQRCGAGGGQHACLEGPREPHGAHPGAGKNKPPTKPHWTRARPGDDGPSEMSAAGRAARRFDADYEAEEAERRRPSGAGPTRRRCRARATRRKSARGSSEAAVANHRSGWRRGDGVSRKSAPRAWSTRRCSAPPRRRPRGRGLRRQVRDARRRAPRAADAPPAARGAERDAGPSKGRARRRRSRARGARPPKPPRPRVRRRRGPRPRRKPRPRRRRTSRKTRRRLGPKRRRRPQCGAGRPAARRSCRLLTRPLPTPEPRRRRRLTSRKTRRRRLRRKPNRPCGSRTARQKPAAGKRATRYTSAGAQAGSCCGRATCPTGAQAGS